MFSDYVIIEQLVILPFFTLFFVSMCAQRVPSSRERSIHRTRDDSASVSQKQASIHEISTEKEPAKRSQHSQKSQRGKDPTMDSIKIMRGRKPQRKPKDPKELKPERSDSQHTEVINVPLGKAANQSQAPSNLTPKSKKDVEVASPSPSNKVQFAENIIKNSKAPPPPPKEQKEPKEPSKKSKRSLKSTFSKKSISKKKSKKSKK